YDSLPILLDSFSLLFSSGFRLYRGSLETLEVQAQTCQRVLTIKPHCFSRPFPSVPTSAVHSDQVPALGSDRFVTVPDCAEGSCLPDNSSTNTGEASHGYEVGREKVNTLAEQAPLTGQTRAERTKIPSLMPCWKT